MRNESYPAEVGNTLALNADERAQARRVIVAMEHEAEEGSERMRVILRNAAAQWRRELLSPHAD